MRLTDLRKQHLFQKVWEYRLGTVSDKCNWGLNQVYERYTLLSYVPYKTNSVKEIQSTLVFSDSDISNSAKVEASFYLTR